MPGPNPIARLLRWVASRFSTLRNHVEFSTSQLLCSRRKTFNIQKAVLSGIGSRSRDPLSCRGEEDQRHGETLREMQQRITDLERALRMQIMLPRKVAKLRRRGLGLTGSWAPMNSHRMQKELQLLNQWLYPQSSDGEYCQQCPPEYYSLELKDWFQRSTRTPLNLEQPQTFNEKTQWLKLHDSTNLKTKLADKFLVREWVKEKIGPQYLTPLIGVYDKAEDIPFDILPQAFVVKATHGSGMNLIVTDKQIFDWQGAQQRINSWMKRNHAFEHGFELHYAPIVPRILVEAYLESGPGAPEDRKKPPYTMDDYKVWCFGGKAHFIQFATGHVTAFYNTKWEKQDFAYGPVRQTVSISSVGRGRGCLR